MVAAFVVCAFTFVPSSFADGLPTRSRVGTPDAVAAPFSWTGFYLGGGLGYGFADTELNVSDVHNGLNWLNVDGLSGTGAVGDIRVGADYQFAGTPLVVGVLAGYNFGSMEFNASAFDGNLSLSAELEPTWYAGGRLGLALPTKTLVYVGAAYQEAEGSFSTQFSEAAGPHGSQTADAVVYMLGLEQALTNNWRLGVEYNYAQYQFDATADCFKFDIDPDVHTIKARLTLAVNPF